MHELTAKRIEAEKAEKVRIANAVSTVEVTFSLFFFLQLFQHRFIDGSGLENN